MLLISWAVSLIFAFTLLQYGTGQHVRLGSETVTFGMLLYHSGETFFTLGYGDIVPTTPIARALAVSEAGMGFAFLGVVIGYLPVIYSSFNARELEISLLDSRAGSPPSATEFVSRLGCCPDPAVLDGIFRDWERWSANLLSNQISYPVLSFFRSQHSNQSWLGALTVMLDVTSLVIGSIEGIHTDQAKLTFAMARHAAVDLAQVINAKYNSHAPDRLAEEGREQMRKALAAAGVRLRQDEASVVKLAHLRSLYEPYVEAMSRNLQITLPPWIHHEKQQRQLARRPLGPRHPGPRPRRKSARRGRALLTSPSECRHPDGPLSLPHQAPLITSSFSMKHIGENVVRIEAEALRALADRIAGPMADAFDRAVELMDACRGRVVVHRHGQERHHRAQDRCHAEFHRHAGAVHASG